MPDGGNSSATREEMHEKILRLDRIIREMRRRIPMMRKRQIFDDEFGKHVDWIWSDLIQPTKAGRSGLDEMSLTRSLQFSATERIRSANLVILAANFGKRNVSDDCCAHFRQEAPYKYQNMQRPVTPVLLTSRNFKPPA